MKRFMSKEGDGAQEAYGREREVETLRAPGPTGAIETPVEHLDLATVLKVSQAVSGEMVQEKQLEILMRTAIEQAGAERGVLVLSRWTEPRIAAQATTGDGGTVVKLHDEAMTPAVLPESVIQYVVRTNEGVILDDAAAQNPFSADPYIRQQHARSILCLPFLNQGQLIGVLYLENNLTPGVFAPARIAVLKLLASQAAISLENARLYRDLAEREAKIRRLVEAQTRQAEDELRAIIDNAPVFLWSVLPDGHCDFINQPWLTYFNLSLQEAQGAGWATLLHPDDAVHPPEIWQKSVSTGIPFETEARYRSPDGEYRWFLIRANPLRDKTGRIVKWHGTNIDIENLKRTERRLRQSEAYLAEAQKLSHTGSAVYNQTKIRYWSEETYRIWGFDPLQGIPSREVVWQRMHPDDRDRACEEAELAWREKRGYSVEFRIVLPDGTVKHLEANSRPVFSTSGELVEVIVTHIDLTERKHAEHALRESEAKIRRLVDANIIGIHIWDFEGRIIEANDAFLRMVDYDREDLVSGRIRWTELTPPEWLDRGERRLRELKVTGSMQPFEMEYFRKDGSRVPVLTGAATFEEAGNQGVAFVLDLTARKRAEEALKDSEEALRRSEAWLTQAQRLSHTGNWVYNATTMLFLYWSDESYRIWGFDPLQGLPSRENMWQRVHPDDRDRVLEAIQEALRQKKDFTGEFRILLPDGTVKYLEATAHHEFSSLGALVEVVSTHVDVTERKRAQDEHERLRQLEADLAHMNRLSMMGELSASLAHEITQPIASARNNARAAMRFMDRNPPDLGEVREALECIVADADRAGDIIDRIRDHIKKAPPRKGRFDLNKAINEVIALAESAITTNGVSVRTSLAEALLPVQGDRVQLQQVVLNLILNAVEAMSTVEAGPRELLISTEQTQTAGVLVSVCDSGPGIDPDHVERVFEAFYTTKSSGVGMGLSICRSIIDAHGGRLWADMNASRGAVFRFILPGADKELTNSLRPAHLTREPHEDTVSDAAHQPAYEGNKRPHRSGRGRGQRRRGRQ
jgi:PAS domain S-box-containing protein